MPRKAKQIKDIKQYARQFTDLAMNTLIGVAGSPRAAPQARVTAAQGLLDRGWGKAAQVIEGEQTLKLVIERIERQILDPKDAQVIEHQRTLDPADEDKDTVSPALADKDKD